MGAHHQKSMRHTSRKRLQARSRGRCWCRANVDENETGIGENFLNQSEAWMDGSGVCVGVRRS